MHLNNYACFIFKLTLLYSVGICELMFELSAHIREAMRRTILLRAIAEYSKGRFL